jgi:hypothetical protein
VSAELRRRGATLAGALGVLGLALAGAHLRIQGDDGTWRPAFAASRALVANELDVSSSADRVARSPDWIVTSGSLFSDDGAGWTGLVDGRTPDPRSQTATGSAVFRVVSQPTFLSCVVELDLRLDDRTTTPRTPPRAYDGVHIFVRYRNPWNLYAVSVARRDGLVVVKRKESRGNAELGPDDNAGYVTLATATAPFPFHTWHHVAVGVSDVPGGVRLTLAVDGRTLLDVVDEGLDGGRPLVGPGRIGIRGDNTEFHFRDVVVTPVT